jgi:type I restriction enzyme R subunit
LAWRTIDGVTLDPLGPFNELQTLVRAVLAPAYLLGYLRYRHQHRAGRGW